MHNTRLLLFAVHAAFLPCVAQAATLPQVFFTHADWELVCDNTRTCRAAGYHADGDENHLTVLLTRPAGGGAATNVTIQLGDSESAQPSVLQMRIGSRSLGRVQLDKNAQGSLSPAQTAALLPALLKNTAITWSAGADSYTLSTKGANAVLLKMHEFQGRLGTAGALVRKGKQPESGVLPALPVPEVNAVQVPDDHANRQLIPPAQRPALIAELRTTLGSTDENTCDDFDESVRDPATLQIYRVSASRLLVAVGCYRGAYNHGSNYWVIHPQPPFSPVLVTNAADDYAAGQIFHAARGRGIGDCMSSDTWTWDGRQFVHTASLWRGMCKEIRAGGAWDMPTLVTKLNKPQ